MIRIIAGSKRGMKLFLPKTPVSRAITDRVKEALFSVLWNHDMPAGKVVADLFCGVGSLGLEALSRGARFVTFVENDATVAVVLKRNIEKAGFVGESKVARLNVFKAGAPAGPNGEKYQLVFVDPPYVMSRDTGENSLLGGLLGMLCGQVADNGIVAVRTEREIQVLERYGGLRLFDRREWGTMAVALLQLGDND